MNLVSASLQIPRRFAPGIVPNPDISGLDSSTNSSNFVSTCRVSFSESLTTTYVLMRLDFPKRSARKILERIIPPPSGGRVELRFSRYTTALRAWYNSSRKLHYTSFLKLGSHYQRVSLSIPPYAEVPPNTEAKRFIEFFWNRALLLL